MILNFYILVYTPTTTINFKASVPKENTLISKHGWAHIIHHDQEEGRESELELVCK